MDLIAIVLIVGAINGIAISLVLLTLKNANPLATRIFGCIVLLFTLLIVEELAEYLQFTHIYPHIIGIGDGLILIIGPLLFLYALVITDRKKRLLMIDLLYLIPFVLLTIYLLPYYLQPGPDKITNFIYDESGIISLLKAIITFTYFFLSLFHIIKFNRSQKKVGFPSNNLRNILWYKGMLFALIAAGFIIFIAEILWNRNIRFQLNPDTIAVTIVSCIFYINSIVLIRNPFILWGTSEFDITIKNFSDSVAPQLKKKYRTSPLTSEDLKKNLHLLIQVMETDKPYLIPDLSPSDIETLTGIKGYYISQTLSEVLNKNFFEFINAYRVDEVKRLILDSNQNHKTMLALGFESGFNSKATFNRIFKQYTGVTPSQFKLKSQS